MKLKRLYRLSLICGISPIFIGTVIFAILYFIRADILVMAGLFTIYGGIACFIVGLISLIFYECQYWREKKKIDVKKGILPLLILLCNFPLAILIVSISINLITQYTLTIINDTDFDVSNISLIAPGVDVDTGLVKSRESRTVKMHFKHDGVFEYHTSLNNKEVHGTVEGYVCNNIGGDKVLIIKEDEIMIKDKRLQMVN